ncbi:MAG: putative lipid II flippase FtsW [Patescibacteria group bacterium]|jgi:cell division protein FtsW
MLNNFKEKKVFHSPDKPLLFSVFALIVLGLIFLSSASSVVAYVKYGSTYHLFANQLWISLAGLGIFWLVYRIDYQIWRKYAFFFLLASCFLLALVFIPGLASNWGTSNSWINVFGFSLQPSEFVKIFFLLYLAAFIESRKNELANWRAGFGPFLVVLGVIGLMMLLQPDMGTLIIISLTSLAVYFVGGGKLWHIVLILLVALLLIFVMVQIKPYQKERFACVFSQNRDSQGKCYQLEQSLIAVGSGGVIGRGLGQSRQKFLYLPEAYGDSIFAVIAEEIGFIFSLVFIALYVFLFLRLMQVAKTAPDLFGKLIAVGIGLWLIIQAFVNIGGVIGAIPMTGVPLPFASQGGSSLLAVLIALGVAANISRQTVHQRE